MKVEASADSGAQVHHRPISKIKMKFPKIFNLLFVSLPVQLLMSCALSLPSQSQKLPRSISSSPPSSILLCPTHTESAACQTVDFSPADLANEACFDLKTTAAWNLAPLYKNIASASIPDGIECTFSQSFGCVSEELGEDSVLVHSGFWNFDRLPSFDVFVNFTDLAGSFRCTYYI
ncbi:hypothetical protein CVT26_010235 [Gymnopilus dilepis]|uniref:Uncharacterized protein n=1 Tax=Gymnopilus dilepis TaxID=231916 RepID=A0A409Y165_9AGAR|nr:hypothetical protein CVT26_010235 [Gymnopilus dilepis]